MTAPKPTKISQRKKLELTDSILRSKEKLKQVIDTSVTHSEKDFSSKYDTVVAVFVADWHLGAKHLNLDSAINVLEYVLNTPNAVMFLLGDNLNTAILNAVSNMFEDVLYPQEQVDLMTDLLAQVAKQDKICLYHDGNHETRVYKQTGLSLGKQVTKAINAEETYAPHLGISEIHLRCKGSTDGKFIYRLTSHHGDHTNFSKMKNQNPGSYLRVVGHWHRFEMFNDVSIVIDKNGNQYLLESINIKLPNAGKTPFEYPHLEKTTSPYYAMEISCAKNPLFNPDSKNRLRYAEFVPVAKSIPILNIAKNRKKDKAIKDVKEVINKKQYSYYKEYNAKINEANEILKKAQKEMELEAKEVLSNLFSSKKQNNKERIKE